MFRLSVSKWGNSNAVRIPREVLNSIGVEQGEFLTLTVEDGKLILEKEQVQKEELTFEELFKDYNGEQFQSELIRFEPTGNELW